MTHDCEEFMPDTVEITFNEYARSWAINSQINGFSDFSEENHFSVLNEIVNIKFCPYCGKELRR